MRPTRISLPSLRIYVTLWTPSRLRVQSPWGTCRMVRYALPRISRRIILQRERHCESRLVPRWAEAVLTCPSLMQSSGGRKVLLDMRSFSFRTVSTPCSRAQRIRIWTKPFHRRNEPERRSAQSTPHAPGILDIVSGESIKGKTTYRGSPTLPEANLTSRALIRQLLSHLS